MSWVRGVDAAYPQGELTEADWREMVARLALGFAVLQIDQTFAGNLAACRAIGLPVGAYAVATFQPGLDPAALAAHHWSLMQGVGSRAGELAPMLDWETPSPQDWPQHGVMGAQTCADACTYATELGVRSGRRVRVYAYEWWLQEVARGGGDLAALAEIADLHVAAYLPNKAAFPGDGEAMPTLHPWPRAVMWQCSSQVARTAKYTPIDCDVVESPEALAALLAP